MILGIVIVGFYFVNPFLITRRYLRCTPTLSSGTIDEQLMKIRFGYEKFVTLNNIPSLVKHSKSSREYFLCQPTRPRGCEPLFNDSFQGEIHSLPCVTNGVCPYIQFRCSNGHEWKGSILL